MSKKNIEIERVGEVGFFKSKRAKRLRITIKPGGEVRVTVPYLVSLRAAKKFVVDKQAWIQKHVQEQKERENYTVFDESTIFRTNSHKLSISRNESDKPKGNVTNGEIRVVLPMKANIYAQEIQKLIKKTIEEAWRKEAKKHLPTRTEELAQKYGFQYSKVTIRNTTSRWGSCSYANNINYSLHLMRVPKELQDYVILHELSHTKEKNHQAPFWELLNSVTGGHAKELDKRLKQYSTKIY